jgi:lipooligosaccharide transport system ATP-binding protein
MDPILNVDQVHKTFVHAGKSFKAVDGLSFSVAQGECFGLLGPNGAGKSTTMKMLLGLTPTDQGRINLLGYDIPRLAREARYEVGVVPQADALDPDFSVEENLRVYGRYFGLTEATISQRIPSLLEFAQLESKKDANIRELSGGMKRRLTIARALVNDPKVLVLDEPTTGLDPQARHLIWERLKRLLLQGKTIVITTHFMEEAERLCDRLAIVDHGKRIALDTPRNLIAREVTPYVIELIGDGLAQWYEINHSHWQAQTKKQNNSGSSGSGPKIERFGDTAYIHCLDPIATLKDLQEKTPLGSLRAIQRTANLEDVFLKLTGRELRD